MQPVDEAPFDADLTEEPPDEQASGHTAWADLEHKATPEQLDQARSEAAAADPVLAGLPQLILARATITTGGMRAGDLVKADPLSPFVRQCFAEGWLVRE
jgi:hypothetical protein